MHYWFNPQLYEKYTVICHYGDFTTLKLDITEISFSKLIFHRRYINIGKALHIWSQTELILHFQYFLVILLWQWPWREKVTPNLCAHVWFSLFADIFLRQLFLRPCYVKLLKKKKIIRKVAFFVCRILIPGIDLGKSSTHRASNNTEADTGNGPTG